MGHCFFKYFSALALVFLTSTRPDPEQLAIGQTNIPCGIEPATHCAKSQSLSHRPNFIIILF